MAGETVVTVIGNLTSDPELRFTPSGAAVANFTVASTPRAFDKQANEWRDQETLFLRCSVWRDMAESVAESLSKGTRVIVQGRLKARSYETKEGDRRYTTELEVDEIGPSLKYATAKVTRNQRGTGNSSQGFGPGPNGGHGYAPRTNDPGPAPRRDTWDAGAPSAQDAFDGMPPADIEQEPPF
ncbi:single-stranded DNA-binding protein [Kocuria sp. CPCC 205297]|uniref:single-stranded DNA-binding protein n=1 Tax=Kocuria sp. CPCC 205297 TaxID=3073558 RepID=UPI0034D5C585